MLLTELRAEDVMKQSRFAAGIEQSLQAVGLQLRWYDSKSGEEKSIGRHAASGEEPFPHTLDGCQDNRGRRREWAVRILKDEPESGASPGLWIRFDVQSARMLR